MESEPGKEGKFIDLWDSLNTQTIKTGRGNGWDFYLNLLQTINIKENTLIEFNRGPIE